MKTRNVFLMLLCFVSVAVQTTSAQTKRFDFDAAAKLVRLSDPQISPDNKSIVVVVSRANFTDNRWENQLVLVETAAGANRVLTSERHDVRHPRWSPSGDRLAFIASTVTGKENRPQIFVMSMSGGEAKRITSAPNGVQHFAWKPDGLEMAFATQDDSPNKTVGDREIAFEVGNDHYLTNAGSRPSHIWLTTAEGDKPRRLTSGEWSLLVAPAPSAPAPLSWSPDGKSIAFVNCPKPQFGDADQSTVQILDVSSGSLRPLTSRRHFERTPSFSPDGSRLAYWFRADGDLYSMNQVYVAPSSGGEGTVITREIDRNIYRSLWMPDGKSILLGGNDGTRVSLWLKPLDGNARRLDLGNVSPANAFWVDLSAAKNGTIAFIGSEPQRPSELYYLPSSDAVPKRLTDFNGQIAALTLGKVDKLEWISDGFQMDGVLTYPPEFRPGETYPLVLLLHGGPVSASRQAFNAQAQLMAAQGWMVFEPNYRGSDNLGSKFIQAIINDKGAGPGRDVMAGIEELRKRRFVDESRIAVSGWSYGGFMTSWLISHYQIWKAAVAGAAVTDWFDSYNLGDFSVRARHGFQGLSPWVGEGEKVYREQSPITYASRIKTPTLILSTTGDVRVPITQSYKLYHALRDNGVPVKFIAYPVSGHAPADPVRQRDVNERWIQWIEQHFTQPATSQN